MAHSTRRWVLGSLALTAALGAWVWSGSRGKPQLLQHLAAPQIAVPPNTESEPASDPSVKAPPRVVAAPSQPKSNSPSAGRIETVVSARWGGKSGELGRKAANESNPEGPMSFTVDERWRAYVLDQVNSRVQIFDPSRAPKSIALPSDTFQDVALSKNDGLAVLDRLSTSSVAFVDGQGKVTHEIALAGRGVTDGGDVTALFSRDDGIWVEVKHQNLVHLSDADENPLEEREIVQGRFGGVGSVLRASKSGERAVFVAAKTRAGVAPLAKVAFEMPVWEVSALETDARGRIFLGASLLQESPVAPFDVEDSAEVVVLLADNGAELARVALPASTGPEESFRRIHVGADGALYHLSFDEQGATLRRVWL